MCSQTKEQETERGITMGLNYDCFVIFSFCYLRDIFERMKRLSTKTYQHKVVSLQPTFNVKNSKHTQARTGPSPTT